MKIALTLLPLLLISLMGCSTPEPSRMVTLPDPETVMVTYHVKAGQEAGLERFLAQAWKLYMDERLVVPRPHTVVRGPDGEGKSRYVEVFTWVSHAAPDHAPASVTALWGKMTALCENRDGHAGLEGGEVHFIQPPK